MLGTRPLGPGRRCPPILIQPASQQGGGGEVDEHGRWSQGGVGGARNQFNFLIRLMCSKSGGKLGGPARSGQGVVKGAGSPGSQSAARWFINIRAWGRGRPSQCLLYQQVVHQHQSQLGEGATITMPSLPTG